MIHAVFFDIDGTLYDFDRANEVANGQLKKYCEKALSLSQEQFSEEIEQARKLLKKRVGRDCSAVHNRLLRYQCLLELLRQPLFPHAENMYHAYWDTLLEVMEPEAGVLEVMAALKEEGLYVGIGTNMTAYMQYQKLKKLGITRWVDGIVTSEEAGVQKPDSGLFLLCAEKAESVPENCMFVGDDLRKDVEGACKVGMKGIFYCPKEEKEASEQGEGFVTIRHFNELREMVMNHVFPFE